MKSSVQLTDISVTTLSGSTWNEEPKKSGKGCWVGVGAAIAIVFAAAVVATIVGLLVFYLHPDRKTSEDVMTTTTTTATTTECIDCTTTAPPVDYRLPGDMVPYFYDARLRPNFYEGDIPKESYTNGSVSILFGVKSETKDIVLHSKTLAVFVDSITVEDDQGRNLSLKSTSYDKKREFFTIKMTDALQTGSNYTVSMQFNCSLKADLTGIYLSTYQDANNQPVYIVTSQAQATEARKMFPCFDEPAIKAVFNITLERKTNWKSFSNTEIDQTYNISDDWVADKYLPTPPMSTYLLAVVISQFQCVDNMAANGRVKVSVCSRKEYLNQTEFANSVAAEMQDYYVDYYNISYPLPKMAHMAVPDFSAGAMENWGLILYRETALLYDDASSSAYYRQRVAIVVAHELAHQWFGNLVTPQWWDDIWLNEGFASYMEITCTDNSFPNWDMEGQFVVDDLQSVLTTDSLVSSHPIYQEVNDPAQINELFDSIAYSKGASIIRMMRYFLGDEIFRWGISDYLKNRSYTAAHHLDLFRALTESAQNRGKPDINVTEIMQTWILQLGYPVIHVMYNNSSGSISLKQEHFLLNRNETPPASPYGYKWIVPISIVTSVSGDFNNARQGWLNSTEGTIQADTNADWIIVNSMQQYYYRVNYDAMAWNALISQLMQNHTVIHSNNRAQLIDDSFNLGRAGYIDVEKFLEITKYLNKEEAYVPWRATWKDMAFLKRMFELSGSYEYLKKYVQQQVQPIYASIGWSTPGADNHLRERHQGIVLDMACSYGNEDCLKEAAKQFMSWMENSTSGNPIDPNVRAVAYCSGIETGGSAEWQFAWQRFLDAPSSSEATTLLQSLACTKEIYLLSGYLDKALALDGIRLQDFRTVLTSVSRNPAGRSMAWDFVRQNWNQLLEWFRDSAFTLPSIVRDVTQSFSTEWELKELEYFRDNTEDFATATRAVEQAIENTKSNIEWRQRNEQKVAVWLKNNTKSI